MLSHKLNMLDGECVLYKSYFTTEESNSLYAELLNQVAWQQEAVKLYGRELLQPRLTAYYGSTGYKYSGLYLPPTGWNNPLISIKNKIEPLLGKEFNGCLLNQYRDGNDSIGWHSDDETDLIVGGVIASISFGDTRRFLLRRKDDHNLKLEVELHHGDLFIMGGTTQTFWQHHVPKTKKSTSPRINLTFRILK